MFVSGVCNGTAYYVTYVQIQYNLETGVTLAERGEAGQSSLFLWGAYRASAYSTLCNCPPWLTRTPDPCLQGCVGRETRDMRVAVAPLSLSLQQSYKRT